jgi:hypothetical protein
MLTSRQLEGLQRTRGSAFFCLNCTSSQLGAEGSGLMGSLPTTQSHAASLGLGSARSAGGMPEGSTAPVVSSGSMDSSNNWLSMIDPAILANAARAGGLGGLNFASLAGNGGTGAGAGAGTGFPAHFSQSGKASRPSHSRSVPGPAPSTGCAPGRGFSASEHAMSMHNGSDAMAAVAGLAGLLSGGGRAHSQGSRSSATRHKCPACLQRDGEFKYFGLSVRICKACYQLWSHHDAFRQQHKETMDEHIKKCIKNTASQRRLRVVYDLRASASGANPELCGNQSADTFTLLLYGMVGIENVLSSVITAALARYPGLEVSCESIAFGREPNDNRVRLFISGPTDHVKGATIRAQSVCQVFDKCTMRLFEGKVHDDEDDGVQIDQAAAAATSRVANDSTRALDRAAAQARAARAGNSQSTATGDSGHGGSSAGEGSASFGNGSGSGSGPGSGPDTPVHSDGNGAGSGGDGICANNGKRRNTVGYGDAPTAKVPHGARGGASVQTSNAHSASPTSSADASDDTTTSSQDEEREATIRLHGDLFSTVRVVLHMLGFGAWFGILLSKN